MSSEINQGSDFDIIEHVIPCQHLRGYPHAVNEPSAVLKLAVKQYVPTHHGDDSEASVNIIATHANGIVKVLTRVFVGYCATRADNEGNV